MRIRVDFEAETCQDCPFLTTDNQDYICNVLEEHLQAIPIGTFDPTTNIHPKCPYKETK